MRVAASTTLVVFLLTGCSDRESRGDRTGQAQGPLVLPAVEHHFGIIPHGESREFDFEFDVGLLPEPYVPLRVQIECSCGHGQVHLVHRNRTERTPDGTPNPANAPGPDERLVARVTIDTKDKEANDLASTTSRGSLVLQPVRDKTGAERLLWPILLHYGIDAPVAVHPFTVLDFGAVAQSQTGSISTTLEGDEQHPMVQFGPVVVSHQDLTATLEPVPDSHQVKLNVTCTPSELGNHRALITVGTDLRSGYRINLETKWKVVPDLEATPSNKVSFRCDLTQPQSAEQANRQFVIVTDHASQRPAEFSVQAIVSDDGVDASSSFALSLVPIPGQARQHRLLVRYLGGQPHGFRGRIVLGKAAAGGPTLNIELVAFPQN